MTDKVHTGVVVTEEEREKLVEKSILQFKSDYREYAIYSIVHRAVPDIRDGLQPVHRRILYSMAKLGCRPNAATMKSARIVGDVIGKYHPHGDSAVYDAMVRMAQPWSMRYEIIHGQGNFGSIDGDSPAAMRYTEAKLSKFGDLSLGKELNMGAVDFVDNYDGKMKEPTILPVEVPYLLLNSNTGIAVGIAVDFLPHNFKEVMEACIAVMKKRTGMYANKSVESLVLSRIQGPDFPTGGIVVSQENALRDAYRTGRGTIALRAKIEVEQLPRGEWQLVVTELPYGVQKEGFIIDIANYINMAFDEKKNKRGGKKGKDKPVTSKNSKKATLGLLIEDIADESEKNNIRIVIKPKSKTMNPDDLIMHLFSVTNLQITVKVNMNALVHNGQRPKQVSLFECIERFLDFRESVIIKASRFRLGKVEARIHILEGLMIAIDNIDKVIHIIRTEDDPESVMMKEFNLSEVQVEAIVEMRLKRLKKLGMDDVKKELAQLKEEQKTLISLISDDNFRTEHMINRFKELIKLFGDERRSEITFGSIKAKTMDATNTIPREPATAVITKKGWVKFIKGKDADVSKTKLVEGDSVLSTHSGYTNDNIIFIGQSGRAYTMPVANLPSGRTEGKHVGAFFDMAGDRLMAAFIAEPEKLYLFVSDLGYAVKIRGKSFFSSMKKGKQMITTGGKVSNLFISPLEDEGAESSLVVTSDGKIAVVPLDEIPELPKGKGNKLVSLTGDAKIKHTRTCIVQEENLYIDGENAKVDLGSVSIARARVCKKIDTRVFNRLVKTYFA